MTDTGKILLGAAALLLLGAKKSAPMPVLRLPGGGGGGMKVPGPVQWPLYRETDPAAVLTDNAVNWNDRVHPGDVTEGGTSALVRRVQEALNGYCGKCSKRMNAVCRRFDPQYNRFTTGTLVVNGIANASTVLSLRNLLAGIPGYGANALFSSGGIFPDTPAGWATLVDVVERQANFSTAGC